HNEADEPSATQPLMYQKIKKHPTPRKIYADKLEADKVATLEDSPKKYLDMYSQYMSEYQKQHPDLFYGDWADKPWRGTGEYYAN
ncbi:thiamine pyrophosphate-dependent enzyme, partial [Salmonella enterica subsp. enterica serovar Cerro]|nr:thiamine pyrophosphate-dependent enzyme [Salmonella enterica subsp. enterica serovar Cerro]